MLSLFQVPIPERYFLRHRPYFGDGEAVIAMLVSAGTTPALAAYFDRAPGARLRWRSNEADGAAKLPPVHELAWNHTTLRALRVDPAMTYLQMMAPRDTVLDSIARLVSTFGDEVLLRFEFTRFDGVVTLVGSLLVRFTTEARLEEIVTIIEDELRPPVFIPHLVTLEEGGMKRTNPAQLAFKRENDPQPRQDDRVVRPRPGPTARQDLPVRPMKTQDRRKGTRMSQS